MNTQSETNEMLAVLLSEVKKITKHLGLDRRKSGEGDPSGEVMHGSQTDAEILQNISTTIGELSTRKFFTNEQIEQLKVIAAAVSDYSDRERGKIHGELKMLLDPLNKKLDEHQSEPSQSTTRHEHHFTVDFKNSKAALTMTVMALLIVVSLGFNWHLTNRNSDLRDNDIKYRYIKMQGKASVEDIYRMESVFGFDRNRDSIRTVRHRVEKYEQLLKEYNERQLQNRLNDERARQIEQEAATVKGR